MENNKTESHEAPNKNYTPLQENIINSNKTILKPIQNQDISSPQFNKPNTSRPKIYKQFIKLIKRNKGLTAVSMADILGISRQTVSKWLDTPQARTVISNNIEYHYNQISNSRDWKAHAYIIDRAKGQDNQTNVQVNILEGLTIVRR